MAAGARIVEIVDASAETDGKGVFDVWHKIPINPTTCAHPMAALLSGSPKLRSMTTSETTPWYDRSERPISALNAVRPHHGDRFNVLCVRH